MELFSVIVSIITLIAVIIAAVVNISNMVSKSASKAAENAETKVMLRTIDTKVDGIAARQVTIESTLREHGEKLVAVEASTKSAHHRLDEITGVRKAVNKNVKG